MMWRLVSMSILPAIAEFINQDYSNKLVATQIPHDAGLAPEIEPETAACKAFTLPLLHSGGPDVLNSSIKYTSA